MSDEWPLSVIEAEPRGMWGAARAAATANQRTRAGTYRRGRGETKREFGADPVQNAPEHGSKANVGSVGVTYTCRNNEPAPTPTTPG